MLSKKARQKPTSLQKIRHGSSTASVVRWHTCLFLDHKKHPKYGMCHRHDNNKNHVSQQKNTSSVKKYHGGRGDACLTRCKKDRLEKASSSEQASKNQNRFVCLLVRMLSKSLHDTSHWQPNQPAANPFRRPRIGTITRMTQIEPYTRGS